ncbi:MAG: glycosyltransferase family 4 protein [Leeuwenhoekiella sp.]
MKVLKKILVSHPTGNANVRSLLEGLVNHHLLYAFYTGVAVFPGNFWSLVAYLPGLSDFKRREFDDNLRTYTKSHPIRELGRLLSSKVGLSPLIQHEHGFFSVDQNYRHLDLQVSKAFKKTSTIKAVYAYEDGALISFVQAKKNKIRCFYDLPIGYWRAMRSLLEPEIKARPEWKATMTGFQDSQDKVARKDQEIELADHIFVASRFTKKTLEQFPKILPPVHIIPYGFPQTTSCKTYRKIQGSPLKLLFVGGLSQRKGIAQLFEACSSLQETVTLKIIGNKAVQDCQILNASLEQINWVPSLPHKSILKEMRKADIFVFPSLFEGYGLVIAEAMAQGTPVITTDRTCGADYIDHGKNGWLIEAGNTAALKQQLYNLTQNPEVIAKVGKAAFRTARANPSSEYGSKMAKLLIQLI